jgi:hypothetical protein
MMTNAWCVRHVLFIQTNLQALIDRWLTLWVPLRVNHLNVKAVFCIYLIGEEMEWEHTSTRSKERRRIEEAFKTQFEHDPQGYR